MNLYRKQEILEVMLGYFVYLRKSPDEYVTVKNIQLARMNRYSIVLREFDAVWKWAVEENLLTFLPGGMSNMGSLALTDLGYARLHNLD